MTGTRGEACGWARSMQGRALRYWSIAGQVRLGPPGGDRGQVDRAGRADEDAGPAGLALVARLAEGRARRARLPPRPNMLIAPRPISSLHVRTHSPQRMHLPSRGLVKGVAATPSSAANSASSLRLRGLASSNSSTVRRDSCTASVSVWTTRPVFDRMAARGHLLRSPGAFRFPPGTRGTRRRATGRDSCRAWGSRCPFAAPRRGSSVGRGGRRAAVDRSDRRYVGLDEVCQVDQFI